MEPHPLDLKRLLEQSPNICALLSKARENKAQLDHIRQHLPPELAAHLQAVVSHDGGLNLIVSTSAWASRLRFALASLRSAIGDRQKLNVKIIPASFEKRPPSNTARKCNDLSPRNARHIRETAASISDSSLRDALIRLASHTPRADTKE